MFLKNIHKKALISFFAFCIILIKDILVSDFKIIPVRSPLNRAISWFIIFPITIIGMVFSLQVIRRKYLEVKEVVKSLFDINVMISMLILLYVVYALLGF
jgi:hypothetical protein